MNNSELVKLVTTKIGQGRTINDVVTMLVMNDEYSTKALARVEVTKVVEDNNLNITKPKPMSVQLKEWYIAQGAEALDLTKKQIETQVLALGMSGGSVKYYTDMYAAASEIAKSLIARQAV